MWEGRTPAKEITQNRLLGRILTAQGLSSLGTSISTVAIAFMVYKITGSVLQMGGILAVSTFPLIVMSFVGGAFVDRFSGRNLMVAADVARAVLILLMPFVARHSTVDIYVVAGLIGVFSAVFNPSQVKVIGELVAREGSSPLERGVRVVREHHAYLVAAAVEGILRLS